MITAIIIVIVLALSVYVFMLQPLFGKLPSGARLERIKKSPNYRDGSFQNLHYTPQLAEGETMLKVIKKFFFSKKERNKPIDTLPSLKTDLKALSASENILVWFGHSSYFIQIDGKKILVDPVLSGSASPISITTKSYAGSDVYTVDDFPEIDLLFISHDHYDHLDYETIVRLKSKVKLAITGLGTGAHLESWGYASEKIIEKDWNEEAILGSGFTVHFVPARHFSGRTLKRNQALWTSFVLQTPTKKIFIGGDSGYDTHFAQIGSEFGPFDLAILECGQYNESWKYIHMLPDELVPAAKDLNAKALMPVHWGKFSLANHAWDEPIVKVSENARTQNMPLVTPMIGEKVDLERVKVHEKWWENVQ
jgi:L-ascorbate metabolism protein UlaG (beta-lactamase superfamily)